MRTINIHEAKTHLSRLVEEVARGEPFIIAKAGKPMAQVTPIPERPKTPRKLGFLAHRAHEFKVPDDFDTFAQDEIIRMFEGKED